MTGLLRQRQHDGIHLRFGNKCVKLVTCVRALYVLGPVHRRAHACKRQCLLSWSEVSAAAGIQRLAACIYLDMYTFLHAPKSSVPAFAVSNRPEGNTASNTVERPKTLLTPFVR